MNWLRKLGALVSVRKEYCLPRIKMDIFSPESTKKIHAFVHRHTGAFFDPKCSVVIHGENLHQKFFGKFNVARYYLNKIGALRNIGVPQQREYKIGWSTSYIDDPDFLLRRPIIKKPIS